MSYVNGAAMHEQPVPPIATVPIMAAVAQSDTVSPDRIEQIRKQLLEPFDPSEIRWRVTATSTQQSKNGTVKRGQLVAYADQRAYTDRLNDVFGEWGWTRTYNVQVAQNFERVTRQGPKGEKQTSICAKVVVVSTVTVVGLGSHTGVGEEWADDENSATRAEAQAFKRACACFGLGRYLYDLDKVWEDLNQHNQPVRTPNLPEWALPSNLRPVRTTPPKQTPQPRQGVVREEALAQVKRLSEAVGLGLAKFTLQKFGGVTEPEKLGFTKLTIVMDKLTDVNRGVERLRAAVAKIGDSRYAVMCQEMNLASDSIDDIPSRDALKGLLQRAESEAGSPATDCSQIDGARGRLLQAARKVAERDRKRLAEVIAEASGGRLSLDGLKDLSAGDLPAVEAAIQRLR
ncbi:MAG: hypothetical protein K2X35_10195 [Bryobacteraceae bacterium]|nr:hypothetical protein [Bryobacteraceae bacterium]